MKSTRLCATLIVSAMTVASVRLAAQGNPPPAPVPPAAAPVSPASSGPIIQVDIPKFDFGKARAGEKVRHTYIITNTGDAMLHITNVQGSCHCTTVGNWSHDIAPGHTGEIAAQLDTTGFGGGGAPVQRMITVYSNARNEPRKTLVIKGVVWKAIDVSPSSATISIAPDATNAETTTVRILDQTDNPITFSNAVSANRLFTATLKEIKPGKEYQLVIDAQPPFTPGNSWGTITVNTSLTNTPVISVPVHARVLPPIQIYPSQIVVNLLPDRATTNRVTIKGTSTNTVLTLSNAKASDSRIHVDLLPLGPKGMYNVVAVFPADFKLEPGQHAEVTVESNQPRTPLLKIPIVEYPRPRHIAALPPHPRPAPAPANLSPAQPNPPPAANHP
jgi:hypothetical protein